MIVIIERYFPSVATPRPRRIKYIRVIIITKKIKNNKKIKTLDATTLMPLKRCKNVWPRYRGLGPH